MKWEDREFNAAIAQYIGETGRDAVETVNKKIIDVGFKAARNTPKKSPEVIETELRKDQIGLKFITKRLRGKIGSSYTTKKGNKRTVKRVTRKQIALRTRQFIARRKKRTGFLRAGWVAALLAAGFTKGARGERLLKDGKSKLGSGRKATPARMSAYLGNAVWGRLKGKNASKARGQMQLALVGAMLEVTADTENYLAERMARTAAKFSARRGSGKRL